MRHSVCLRIERYVLFFGDFNVTTPQRRSSQLTHTQTLTHAHMPGQQWLAGQVVPEEFFRVLQIFLDHKWSARIFGPPGGHATSENISRVLQMFSVVYVYVFTQALCCTGFR